jgi:hypothetical protein
MRPSSWQLFKRKLFEVPFFMKLFHWEFWPFNVVYFPVFVYYAFLAVKARSIFFFSAANPTIEFGGMLGESKGDIFKLIPEKYIPRTRRFPPSSSAKDITTWMEATSQNYPILLKPDIGERGWMVKKVDSLADIEQYLGRVKVDFLAQSYVSYPIELGLFYYRFPGVAKGNISSITRKGLMAVTGDGKTTVRSLLKSNLRARLYIKDFEEKYPEKMGLVPENGEVIEVEPIGNHCRGTTFLDDTGKVTEKMEAQFDQIADSIPGFHFGRFDLRCKSYDELEKGINFKILELNGAGAEPGHIYHPGRSIWKGYRDILHHLNVLCNIAIQNHRLGVPYTPFNEGLRFIKKVKAYNRLKESE